MHFVGIHEWYLGKSCIYMNFLDDSDGHIQDARIRSMCGVLKTILQ